MKPIKHITQSGPISCMSAAIAMLLGHDDDRTVWEQFGREYANGSTFNHKEYMVSQGLQLSCCDSKITHYQTLEVGGLYLVTVPSINIPGGLHSIVWDSREYEGNRYLYDPAQGREGRKWYVPPYRSDSDMEVELNGFFVDCQILGGGIIT